MAIQGKFIIIHGATYSPLIIYGVGTFSAFSGNGFYRNRGGCANIVGSGPLPPGRYYIVDRPTGTWKSVAMTSIKDSIRTRTFTNPADHSKWFGLYRIDDSIDDSTFFQKVARGNFRLHPGTVSEGCITLSSHIDYEILRRAILQQKPTVLSGSELKVYGTIEVIVNDNSCR